REVDRMDVERKLPRRDARHVEEVFYELRLGDRAPFDRLHRPGGPFGVQAAAAQEGRPHADRAERRPQLVRQSREEVVLEPVGLAQLASALLDDLLELSGVLLEGRALRLDLAAELTHLDGPAQRSDEVISGDRLPDEVV